jgi:hypothetical protein
MRTSFHHQPEAQHPNFCYLQVGGRLPHLCPPLLEIERTSAMRFTSQALG